MSDSCGATKINNQLVSGIDEDTDKKFSEYLNRYCTKHNISPCIAVTHAVVKEYFNMIYEDIIKNAITFR